MSLLVLVRWFIILTCSLTIVLPCTQWIKRENYRTGAVSKCCVISCNPGFYVYVCTSNGTSDKCVPCPEGTYMEDPTNSFLPQPCVPHECPPNSIPTDSYPLAGCHKKCRCDVTKGYEGPDPCNCQYKSNMLPGKSMNQNTDNGGLIKTRKTSTDGYFKEESKNKSLKITTEVHLPGDTEQEDKNIEFHPNLITETVLWTTGGIFTILGLILAICCIRRKCHRNTQEPTPFKAQLSTERLQRPQACVRPFINDAVSNHEGTRPLIPPGFINALSGQLDHHLEYSPGQALSHAIDVQDTVTDYLRPAPDMDLYSFDNDDRSQSNDFGENVNRITRTIPIESPNQSTISFNNEEI